MLLAKSHSNSKKEVSEMQNITTGLTQQEQEIIKKFAVLIPKLPEIKKYYLLGIGDGMALKTDTPKDKETKTV